MDKSSYHADSYSTKDFDKPLIFTSHIDTVYKHMTKFRGLSKSSTIGVLG
jgi:hypothetical protein